MLNGRDKVEGAVCEHWVDKWLKTHAALPPLTGNNVRLSADVILWLQDWKNEMLGVKRSIYEETLIYDEKNEQMV